MKRNVTLFISLVFLILGVAIVFANISGSGPIKSPGVDGTQAQSVGGGVGCACCGNVNPEVAGTRGKTVMKDGYQEAEIKVNGGYKPETLEAKAGIPLKLTFTQGTSSCDSIINLGGITVDVTRGPQTVELQALEPGTYEYTCWMNMLKGRIVVSE